MFGPLIQPIRPFEPNPLLLLLKHHPRHPRLNQAPTPQTRDELFMEVFKKPPPKLPLEMIVPLIVQGKSCGKISMSFSEDRREFFFPGAYVLSCLSDILKPEILKELGEKVDSRGMLSKGVLEEEGLTAAFDVKRFMLSILVPDDLQGIQIHHINRDQDRPCIS